MNLAGLTSRMRNSLATLSTGWKSVSLIPRENLPCSKPIPISFLLLCQRRGQKPTTFVPALDDNFEFWFKKDSLWQSEDLEAVIDQDVGRTCILQGPTAARYSKIVDEPIKDILA